MICIALCGGSGSGKSSVIRYMACNMPDMPIALLPMDAYYKDHSYLTSEEKKYCNFDHPDAMDFELLESHLKSLKCNIPIQRPVYSFLTCTRLSKKVTVYPENYIFIEGIFALYQEKLRNMIDFSVFLDANDNIRLERIITRDINERNRSREDTMERFFSTVAPMHSEFIEPMKKYADIVIDTTSNDIPLIVSTILEATDLKNNKGYDLRMKGQNKCT